MTLFRSLDDFSLRRKAALYLLLFFVAVAFASHQHANSLEDLLFDGPSDSGVFLESRVSPDPAAGPEWASARWLDDDPCLACFQNDRVTEVIAVFAFVPRFAPLALTSAPDYPATASTPPLSSDSRAPPSLA